MLDPDALPSGMRCGLANSTVHLAWLVHHVLEGVWGRIGPCGLSAGFCLRLPPTAPGASCCWTTCRLPYCTSGCSSFLLLKYLLLLLLLLGWCCCGIASRTSRVDWDRGLLPPPIVAAAQ